MAHFLVYRAAQHQSVLRIPLISQAKNSENVCLTAALPRLKTGDYEEQCNPHHCWSRRPCHWGRSRLFGFRSWQAVSRPRAREVCRNVRRSQWQYDGDSRFERFPERPGQSGAKLEYASGSSQRRRKPDTSSRSFNVAGASWNIAHLQDLGNSAETKQRPVHHARDTESRVKQPNSGEKCIGCFKPGYQPVAAVIGESPLGVRLKGFQYFRKAWIVSKVGPVGMQTELTVT